MNNPVLNYFLLRLGIFVAVLSVLLLTPMDRILAALFAAVISFALSVIFLRKQRDRVSEFVYNRNQRKGAKDPAANDEDALLDGKTE
jgi:membrane protein implicated in regulation of membrane protease activity